MRKIFLIHVMLLSISAVLYGQYEIEGKITSSESGESLPGANIVIQKTYLSTSTNADGYYFLKNIKPGKYTLKVSYIGYKTHVEKVEINRNASLNISLEPEIYLSEEVIIKAIRADGSTPTSQSQLDAQQIEKSNTGRDLPYILETMPSTVVTSDAGNGVGYSGIRIRGTDLTGINVTLNGVPVNDAESHGVFFVDIPDLASSIDNIQVRRGVGASTNGSASFGASINIKTGDFTNKPYGEMNSAAGSFNTFKNTLKIGSGLIRDKWAFDGRFSWINSDGYVDRATADLRSLYLSGGYYGKKDIIKLIYLNGFEKTYQAWYGIPKDSLQTNRTYNPAGEIYDNAGNFLGFYDNQTDNYNQSYYQLHYAHEFSKNMNIAASLFYTRGIGYYESYKNNQSFSDYGLTDTIIGNDTISVSNMVTRKWLDNHFYGINITANYSARRLELNFGTGWNRYDGDHYGYIVWSQIARLGEYDQKWYDNTGVKTDYHIFGKATYHITESFNGFLDMQYRGINYDIVGTHDDLRDLTQKHNFNFFNPKVGLSYQFNQQHSLHAFAGVANREPNRSVFRDADPGQEIKPEQMIDYELGYQLGYQHFTFAANLFYMDYTNQFVLTGKINNVGAPIMTNVDKSYRTGIELEAAVHFLKLIDWNINATFSQNKINNFTSYIDNWDTWPEQSTEVIGKTDISFSPDITASSIFSVVLFKYLNIKLLSTFVGRQYIDNTENIDRSLDPYFVNNLQFNYSIKTKFIPQIDFIVTLNNIFNEQYETNAWVYRYFSEDKEYELNGYFPQAGFNFMAGISLKF